MKFSERKEFVYDVKLLGDNEISMAMSVQREYIHSYSPIPSPVFCEVDRDEGSFDPLWHESKSGRVKYKREIPLKSLVTSEKANMRRSSTGIYYSQNNSYWVSALDLMESDYFPVQGDIIIFAGRRHIIINPVVDPTAYWAQTNVWLGMVCPTRVAITGDRRPVTNDSVLSPSELTRGDQLW